MKPTMPQLEVLTRAWDDFRPVNPTTIIDHLITHWESIRPKPEPPSAERIREFLSRPGPKPEPSDFQTIRSFLGQHNADEIQWDAIDRIQDVGFGVTPPAPKPTPEEVERAGFEAWAARPGIELDLRRLDFDDRPYIDNSTQQAFWAWRAAKKGASNV